ncbi:MAG: hypothetical protein AAF226_02485 [Verrucomicrobiota bacterium]
MSHAELVSEIENWALEDRHFAEDYLKHLRRKETLENKTDLTSRMQEFDEGKSFSLDLLKLMHESLSAEGK